MEPWSKTKNHDIDNLIMLCPNCHDQAHSKKDLSLNLTVSRLKNLKQEWIDIVQAKDLEMFDENKSSKQSVWGFSGAWDYFNYKRIVEMANSLNIAYKCFSEYSDLLYEDAIAKDGSFKIHVDVKEDPYIMSGGYYYHIRNYLLSFYKNMLLGILNQQGFVVLDEIWNRKAIQAIVKPPQLAILTGRYYFKSLKRNLHIGIGQDKTGYHQKRGIKLEFQFDAFEAMSSTSRSTHLSGNCRSTGVVLVRDIQEVDKKTVLSATCLGLGTGFKETTPNTPVVAYEQNPYHQDEYDWDE